MSARIGDSRDSEEQSRSSQSGQEIRVTLQEIEEVLGRKLPPSARRCPWYSAINPLAKAIKVAGWRASVNLSADRITLRRR